jgi:hypothetical protein
VDTIYVLIRLLFYFILFRFYFHFLYTYHFLLIPSSLPLHRTTGIWASQHSQTSRRSKTLSSSWCCTSPTHCTQRTASSCTSLTINCEYIYLLSSMHISPLRAGSLSRSSHHPTPAVLSCRAIQSTHDTGPGGTSVLLCYYSNLARPCSPRPMLDVV